jgi:rRNA biogenesis protein RRP5
VVKLTDKGCLVAVSENVRGLIPPGHFADTELKNPEKLLVAGKMLKTRVLSVHAPSRRLILTNKKSLVSSELPVLADIQEARAGMVCHGHVAKVQDNGIVVAFYGAVKGFVMLSELGIDRDSEVPAEVFRVNQVVKARILAVDLEEKRIKVSLRTSAADIAAAAAAAANSSRDGKGGAAPAATVLIGDVVEVEVTGKDEEGVLVKSCESGAFGYIPAAHLADYDALCSALLEAFTVPAAGKGDKGSKGSKKPLRLQALVLEHERSKSRYLMSLKRSLVAAAKEEELPSSFSDLRPQQFVQGFVKNVADFGCFVAFLNGVTALAPKNSLAVELL